MDDFPGSWSLLPFMGYKPIRANGLKSLAFAFFCKNEIFALLVQGLLCYL
jgi:hypothetical protein